MDDDGGRPENFIEQFRIDGQAVLHHLIDGNCWVLLMLRAHPASGWPTAYCNSQDQPGFDLQKAMRMQSV